MLLSTEQLKSIIERSDRPQPDDVSEHRRTAVLIPFVQREQTNVLLIHRACRGDPWSNQMAFPGGHIDDTDDSPLDTAYRETNEELGIDRSDIDHLGMVGHFETITAKVHLYVYAGIWKANNSLSPNPEEVANTIELPLGSLLNEHLRQHFDCQTIEQLGDHLVYPLTRPPIWGVTARILHHLLSVIVNPQEE